MDVEILPTKAGAILHGLDLAAPLSDSAFKDVYDTYLQWANIVITGQDHISPDDYIAFCARFGEIIPGIPSTSRQKNTLKRISTKPRRRNTPFLDIRKSS